MEALQAEVVVVQTCGCQTARVAKDRPGGKDALNERVAALAVRVIGIHSAYAPPRQFCYEVELPGMVISASGQLTNENLVSWRFLASRAYPLGYEMMAESLAPNLGAQQRLLGARRVWDHPSMIAYSALLDEEPGLAAVLQACVDQGSLEMLKAYRAQAQQEGASKRAMCRIGPSMWWKNRL